MSNEIKGIEIGSLHIDCTRLASFAVDLPPGEMIGKHGTRLGYEEVFAEVTSNQKEWGSKVGISEGEIAELELANQRIALLDEHLPAVRKLLEILEETRALIDHQRHRRISEIAAIVDARSMTRRNPDLLARYEKTRAYRSEVGVIAAKTRRKNAALADVPTTEE